MRNKRRHGSYKFTEKTHSKRGIAATLMSSLLLAWYLVFVHLAFISNGGLSAYYGCAGVLAMLLSFAAVVAAAGTFKEEDSFKLFPRLGFVLSLLNVSCWCGSYIWGFIG